MRFSLRSRILVATLGFVAALPALNADTLTVTGVVSGITLTIADNSLTAMNSGWSGGVGAYIDPYTGTWNNKPVNLFCVDPDHLDPSVNPYFVNVSGPGTGYANTMQAIEGLSPLAVSDGITTAAQFYGTMAYLSQQLLGQLQLPQTAATILAQQEYQAAIWGLADHDSSFQVIGANAAFLSQVQADQQFAAAHSLTSGFVVLTDVNEAANWAASTPGKSAQEYLVLTPEPASLILLGTGLAGAISRKRLIRKL